MKRTLVLGLFVIGGMALAGCAPPGDPVIHRVVSEISVENIRQSVEKLASFGTRHTLSDTTSETRGIGSARRWIKAELDRYAADSGGRLVVEGGDGEPPVVRCTAPGCGRTWTEETTAA